MTTSPTRHFLSEILEGDPIPEGVLSYFRERLRNHFYEVVVGEFLKQEANGMTRADVARRICRKPEQITRWLGAPGNWTLETVSDLILAVAKSEPKVSLASLSDQVVQNDVSGESIDENNEDNVVFSSRSRLAYFTCMNFSARTAAEQTYKIERNKPQHGLLELGDAA